MDACRTCQEADHDVDGSCDWEEQEDDGGDDDVAVGVRAAALLSIH